MTRGRGGKLTQVERSTPPLHTRYPTRSVFSHDVGLPPFFASADGEGCVTTVDRGNHPPWGGTPPRERGGYPNIQGFEGDRRVETGRVAVKCANRNSNSGNRHYTGGRASSRGTRLVGRMIARYVFHRVYTSHVCCTRAREVSEKEVGTAHQGRAGGRRGGEEGCSPPGARAEKVAAACAAKTRSAGIESRVAPASVTKVVGCVSSSLARRRTLQAVGGGARGGASPVPRNLPPPRDFRSRC